jgi:hypothetical protein
LYFVALAIDILDARFHPIAARWFRGVDRDVLNGGVQTAQLLLESRRTRVSRGLLQRVLDLPGLRRIKELRGLASRAPRQVLGMPPPLTRRADGAGARAVNIAERIRRFRWRRHAINITSKLARALEI